MSISSESLGSFAAGITLCVSLLWCQKSAEIEKDPIEAKKEAIIASMNTILERENLVINPESTCTILIEWNKSNNIATIQLKCVGPSDDGEEQEVQEYSEVLKNPNTETYVTYISKVTWAGQTLNWDQACFQMIAKHPTDPNWPGIKIESKHCIGETI